MRYYLDTNVLVFLLNDSTVLRPETVRILQDYENLFLTSSACVEEVIFLLKRKKIKCKFIKNIEKDLFRMLEDELGIEIVPPTRKHLQMMARLDVDEHLNKDDNDYLIIAQAISDRIPIISTDGDFRRFVPAGLQLVFNKR